MTATHINWERVREIYCGGFVSIADIARECGLSDSTIRKRAQRGGWKRNLVAKVEQRTGEKVVMALAESAADAANIRAASENPSNSNLPSGQHARAFSEEQAIELAALTQVAVIRGHHRSIRKGHDLTQRLFSELDMTTSNLDELEDMIRAEEDAKKRTAMMRAISLPARAGVMRDLAQATKILVQLERQAVGLDERGGPKPQEDTDLDGLLEEIRNDAARLGLRLIDGRLEESEDQGVANRTIDGEATETD